MKVTSKRPSTTKKTLSMGDLEEDTVGMHLRVPPELRKLINQRALDQGRSAKDVIMEVFNREFK